MARSSAPRAYYYMASIGEEPKGCTALVKLGWVSYVQCFGRHACNKVTPLVKSLSSSSMGPNLWSLLSQSYDSLELHVLMKSRNATPLDELTYLRSIEISPSHRQPSISKIYVVVMNSHEEANYGGSGSRPTTYSVNRSPPSFPREINNAAQQRFHKHSTVSRVIYTNWDAPFTSKPP